MFFFSLVWKAHTHVSVSSVVYTDPWNDGQNSLAFIVTFYPVVHRTQQQTAGVAKANVAVFKATTAATPQAPSAGQIVASFKVGHDFYFDRLNIDKGFLNFSLHRFNF